MSTQYSESYRNLKSNKCFRECSNFASINWAYHKSSNQIKVLYRFSCCPKRVYIINIAIYSPEKLAVLCQMCLWKDKVCIYKNNQ